MNQANMMLYDTYKKSVGVAYFLAIFLGGFGIHCFYIGKKLCGAFELFLFTVGWILLWGAVIKLHHEEFAYGLLSLIIWTILWLYDLLTLYKAVEHQNQKVINKISGDSQQMMRPAGFVSISD